MIVEAKRVMGQCFGSCVVDADDEATFLGRLRKII